MTFWEALKWAAGVMGGLAAFIGLLWWTFQSWDFADWPERAANFAAWVLTIAVGIWLISQLVQPA